MELRKIMLLFNQLYDKSNKDLDQLVINESIMIPASFDDEFSDLLKDFLNEITDICLENENVEIVNELPHDENAEHFLEWVDEYINLKIQSINETLFLRKMSLDEFEQITRYCYENYVVYDSDRELVSQMNNNWTVGQIEILRKVLLTVAEMKVLSFYPRNRILKKINELFKMTEKQGDILIDLISSDEDRLWKYLMFKRQERLESMMEGLWDSSIN